MEFTLLTLFYILKIDLFRTDQLTCTTDCAERNGLKNSFPTVQLVVPFNIDAKNVSNLVPIDQLLNKMFLSSIFFINQVKK